MEPVNSVSFWTDKMSKVMRSQNQKNHDEEPEHNSVTSQVSTIHISFTLDTVLMILFLSGQLILSQPRKRILQLKGTKPYKLAQDFLPRQCGTKEGLLPCAHPGTEARTHHHPSSPHTAAQAVTVSSQGKIQGWKMSFNKPLTTTIEI